MCKTIIVLLLIETEEKEEVLTSNPIHAFYSEMVFYIYCTLVEIVILMSCLIRLLPFYTRLRLLFTSSNYQQIQNEVCDSIIYQCESVPILLYSHQRQLQLFHLL